MDNRLDLKKTKNVLFEHRKWSAVLFFSLKTWWRAASGIICWSSHKVTMCNYCFSLWNMCLPLLSCSCKPVFEVASQSMKTENKLDFKMEQQRYCIFFIYFMRFGVTHALLVRFACVAVLFLNISYGYVRTTIRRVHCETFFFVEYSWWLASIWESVIEKWHLHSRAEPSVLSPIPPSFCFSSFSEMSTVMGLVDKKPIRLIIILASQKLNQNSEYMRKLRKIGKRVLFLSTLQYFPYVCDFQLNGSEQRLLSFF